MFPYLAFLVPDGASAEADERGATCLNPPLPQEKGGEVVDKHHTDNVNGLLMAPLTAEKQPHLRPPEVRRGDKRRRRTQAERSAATQEKVVRAATECIAELGFSNTTMMEIARRAGVTWGAMQHQFGDKEAIIDAVIDRSLEEFARQMEGLRETEPELEARVHAFTERAWVVFKGPVYRAILSILLQHREKTERIAAVMNELWGDCFRDLDLSAERQFAAQRFTFVLLSGIATESVVVPGAGDARDHFVVLERTLLEMLCAGPRKTKGRRPR